jgi:hypothetical protein
VVNVEIGVSLVLEPEAEDALVSDAGRVELGATFELGDIVELLAGILLDDEPIVDDVSIDGPSDIIEIGVGWVFVVEGTSNTEDCNVAAGGEIVSSRVDESGS